MALGRAARYLTASRILAPDPADRPAPMRQRPGESDLDYRARQARAFASLDVPLPPEFQTQILEDQAFLKAIEERRSRLRRRLGPSGRGATLFTSPLGVPFAPPGSAAALVAR